MSALRSHQRFDIERRLTECMEGLAALHLLAVAHGNYEQARDAEEGLAALWETHDELLGTENE
jgi:hypothetical protein